MTKQEIGEKREREAAQLLGRSGVGYVYAINTFTPKTTQLLKEQTLSGSDSEAMVKAALQFAFQHQTGFRAYVAEQMYKAPHMRDFSPRG